MATPRFQRSWASKRVRRTAGSLTLNSTGWANVDTALDIPLSAAVGDIVEVYLNCRINGQNVWMPLDVASIVAGAVANVWSLDGPENATGLGIPAWYAAGDSLARLGAPCRRALLAGDIENGDVRLRLRYRTETAANKEVPANAVVPLEFGATNLGPVAPY